MANTVLELATVMVYSCSDIVPSITLVYQTHSSSCQPEVKPLGCNALKTLASFRLCQCQVYKQERCASDKVNVCSRLLDGPPPHNI
ncbi:hypothetical protein DPMN_143907 [Dreissena polymorpha]|uniref:Uncharacterized protein n=1 Tax=Dreissena polymorpha TaxID=45954 RepID=A0A9D4GHX3_DREPO|nr:hypothetical protein DPMN_143907 [Dreissena polymorpha]